MSDPLKSSLDESDPPRPSNEVGVETLPPPPPPPVGLHTPSITYQHHQHHLHFWIPCLVCELNLQTVHSFAQRGDLPSLISLHSDDPSCINSRDAQNVTPLHWAAINAHIGVCRWLLDNGAEIDAVGGDLRATPLQWASRNGHLYVIQLLISRGADPSIRDAQGFSALQLVTHSSAVMPLLYMVCPCSAFTIVKVTL